MIECTELGKERINLYKKIEKNRNSKVISYLLSDNPNYRAQIAKDVINLFCELLDKINETPKITLILYTVGGDTLAAWNIVNLITQYCDEFEVIIPFKAQSAGTLMALRAKKILMTKKSVLGPIDPSITTPLNPQFNLPNIPSQQYPVSVESIREYFNYAKNELGLKGNALADVYVAMSEKIHPLVIGQALRTMNQIKMLAKSLLSKSSVKRKSINKIIKFLCSKSGSHDYTISYKEAKDQLELPVEEITGELSTLISDLYINFSKELFLSNSIDFNEFLKSEKIESNFSISSGLIEGTLGTCFSFVNQGIVRRQLLPDNQFILTPNLLSQGWRKWRVPDE